MEKFIKDHKIKLEEKNVVLNEKIKELEGMTKINHEIGLKMLIKFIVKIQININIFVKK